MRHKLTIEVGEDFTTRVSVDGQLVGLIQRLEFGTQKDDMMPKAVMTIVELDKHQQDVINLLKEIPWLKVDVLPAK